MKTKDRYKTKKQSISELTELRHRVADIEKLKIEYSKLKKATKLNDARFDALLTLNRIAQKPLQKITDFALEKGIELTGSKIGYLAFMNDDETVLTMHSWSKNIMKECAIVDKSIIYPVEKTGLWGEAVRQRKPIITNNYSAPNKYKKGYPEGHVELIRHMNVPIFDNNRIVLVAGVGNKDENYDESDVRQLTLLMDGMWKIIQRKREEEELQRQAAILNAINRVFHKTLICETDREMANVCLSVAEELTGSRFGFIGEINQEGRFDNIAISNPGWDACLMPKLDATYLIKDMEVRGIWGKVIKDKQSIIVNDPVSHPDRIGIPEGHPPITSFLGVPLKDANQTIGMIALANKESGYKLEDQHCIETLSIAFIEALKPKRAEVNLKKVMLKLEQANRDLEQFAYIVSHDLQEPLRMILNYVKLLESRYKDKLDENATDFISFITDGAERMQKMINDLFTYSCVGTSSNPFEATNIDNVIKQVITNLQFLIKENQAIITHDSLPVINADESQMVQLFQNLLVNAIKFRGEEFPRIHISAEKRGDRWIFSVRDNGIGIDPQHSERIFMVFQRLHSRERYPGTGIGLSICKKIVERHRGRIWLESEPGKGSIFYFIIPVS